jgi:hypothetical protein
MGRWLHRARDLKVLSEAGYKKMYQFFGAHGWVKNEPCDEYPREELKLFQQLVFRALGEDLISESKAAGLLRKPLKQFIAMRNLDERAASTRH